jgi:hypothetical protein
MDEKDKKSCKSGGEKTNRQQLKGDIDDFIFQHQDNKLHSER